VGVPTLRARSDRAGDVLGLRSWFSRPPAPERSFHEPAPLPSQAARVADPLGHTTSSRHPANTSVRTWSSGEERWAWRPRTIESMNARVLLIGVALVGLPVVAFGWARSSRPQPPVTVADQLVAWVDAHPGYHCQPTIQEQGPSVETFWCHKGAAAYFLVLSRPPNAPVPSPTTIARRIEQMPVPPFNVVRFVDVRCTISRDRNIAACTGLAKSPTETSRYRQAFSFFIRRDGSIQPLCTEPSTTNAFCMS